ncbi:hypothetical protein ACVWZK_008437 [Bradyrhizobium sp. GM0.4]
MCLLDESVLGANEIDEFGHITFGGYVERALCANGVLIADLGLDPKRDEMLVEVDTFHALSRE